MKSTKTREIIEGYAVKRHAAELEAERRKLEIHSLIPETLEIDRELENTSMKIIAIASSGEDIEKKMADLKEEIAAARKRRGELLVKNGYPADHTDVHYECKKCGDTGYCGIEMCDCLRRAVAEAAFEDSGIGKLVKKQSFDTFSFDYYSENELRFVKMNYEVLKDFAENFKRESGKNFILIGKTGLGKTHLSTSVAKTVIEGGHNVVYDTVGRIVADFEDNRFNRSEVSQDTDRYFNCDLLIIDDLGCEVSNKFTVACIYELINSRINSGRSTLINTNLSQDELHEKYADRITSRIFGEYRPLLFIGRDIREQKLSR